MTMVSLAEKAGLVRKMVAQEFMEERRIATGDRRKLHTFVANDRRSGIADRRKAAEPKKASTS
jgi:hypothetical protein